MTLDQICTMLCDRKILAATPGERTTKIAPEMASAAVPPTADGLSAGRAADGTPIRGRFRGKSKARELMEAEEARLRAEREKGQRTTRRGRRGR